MKTIGSNRTKLFVRRQDGIVLLDALIAIVVFSIGILGMVKLQSNAVTYSADAKFRSQAAMLANQVISDMWVADPATLQTQYQTGGAKFLAWNDQVKGTAALGAQSGLPGGAGDIVVSAAGDVTVTINWQQPGNATPHNYVAVTQIVH